MKNYSLSLTILILVPIIFNGQTIAEFTGNGGKNTSPFTVNQPWKVSWTASGELFQLFLMDMNGEMVALPANQSGSGQGSSFQVEEGRYYFQVNAIGAWKITIENASQTLKPANVRAGVIAEFSGDGTKNTQPFIVEKPWNVSWNASGDLFQIFLMDMEGGLVSLPANQLGSGSGSSFQVAKGKFYLQVNAVGNWSIKITNVQ